MATAQCRRLAAVLAVALELAAEPRGIPPRPHRADYTVTSFTHSFAVAATLLSPGQVHRLFGSEVGERYLVVEVGFYSKNGATFEVRHGDFALRVNPGGAIFHPAPGGELGAAAAERLLPEALTSRAVAGYLFFRTHLAGHEACELEYTGQRAWLTMPVRDGR